MEYNKFIIIVLYVGSVIEDVHSRSGANFSPLKKNTLIRILPRLSKTWSLSLDIKPHSTTNTWSNVFHATIGTDVIRYGDRTPGIWFQPNSLKLTIFSAVNDSLNYEFNHSVHLPRNKFTNIKIEQTFENVKYFFKIHIGGEKVHEVVNSNPREFQHVKLYAADPWYDPANATIRGIQFYDDFAAKPTPPHFLQPTPFLTTAPSVDAKNNDKKELEVNICIIMEITCQNKKNKAVAGNRESEVLAAFNKIKEAIGKIDFTHQTNGQSCNSSCESDTVTAIDIKITSVKDFTTYTFQNGLHQVYLPSNILKYTKALKDDNTKVVTLVRSLLPEMLASNTTIYPVFVSITFNHSLTRELEEEDRIRITFPKPKDTQNLTHECVYWNDSYTRGFWDSHGCRNEENLSNETYTTCSCNHLTDFSVKLTHEKKPNHKPTRPDDITKKQKELQEDIDNLTKTSYCQNETHKDISKSHDLGRIRDLMKNIDFNHQTNRTSPNSSCYLALDIKVSSVKDFTTYTFQDGLFGAYIPKNILKYTTAADNDTIKVITLVQQMIPEMLYSNTKAYTHFVSLTLNYQLVRELEEEDRIRVTFPKPDRTQNLSNITHKCVYWNGSYTTGFWDSYGCRYEETLSSATRTTCSCNHLTDFSVLILVKEVVLSGREKIYLHYQTMIGCSISSVFLALAIAVILYFQKLRHDDHFRIHGNLSFCLLLGNLLILTTEYARQNKYSCFAFTILLYYVFLVAFFWMLCEGVFIWRGVITVFNNKDKFQYYFMFSWGIPLLCTGIIAGAFRSDLFDAESCWLSWKHYAVWAFVGPVTIISLINAFILYKSLVVMKIQMRKESKIQEYSTLKLRVQYTSRATARFTLMLLPIFGCTWVVGIFAIDEGTIVFRYIFTFLNSLQGFFIFLFYIFFNKQVGHEFRCKLRVYRIKKSVNHTYSFPLKESNGNKQKNKEEFIKTK